ncbi:MAG TPA: ABC transporter permease [Gammaproteobacteria bacterium]|nr:ABC transporter permease [Gammaproteobacteria bacterium]
MNNFRYALRQVVKRPALSFVVVLMLAVGIGANAAMFSLFHQILLRPLPVPDPGSLVNLGSPGPKTGSVSCSGIGSCDYVFSYPMLRDLEREQTVFTAIAAHRNFGASIAADGQAISGGGRLVNGGYFQVLNLTAALGRLIGPQDEPQVGEGHVAVLSHAYWQNAFGGDPGVLGRTLIVNGQSLEIIGVAPEGFTGTSFGPGPQVFVPLTLRWLMEPYFPLSDENRQSYWLYMFARLKPGVTPEEAAGEINGPYRAIINDVEAPLNTSMSEHTLARFKEKTLVLEPGARGQSSTPEEARVPLTLLFCVTGLVLLIVCVNIANLLLARGAARAGEMAVRASIGASRRQMVAQLLTEAGVLGALGCIASLPVAAATLGVIAAIMPSSARAVTLELSGPAIGFAVVAAMGTVLLFGLFPALAATRTPPGTVLKGQAGQPSGGRGVARFRNSLATVQIAFSMVLLVLAGLFTQSLANVGKVDLGLRADSVATFSIAPVLNGYTAERSRQLFRRIEEELAALPGVVSVASSMVPVVAGDNWGSNVSVEGFDAAPDTDRNASYNEVGPGFFRTLQIPLLAGRDFSEADTLGGARVAIVNETFARKFALGADAVGKRMATGSGDELEIEIIGLLKDAKYSQVKDEVPPQFFLARHQNEDLGFMNFYVRTSLDPDQVLAAVPGVVASLDPNLPVDNLSTLPDVIRDTVFLDRLIGLLSSGFAVLATLLAATGLYGVLSYSVVQRTRELGLRQALGATPLRLRGMVLRQVGWMALAGGLAGLGFAVLLGRAAEAVLFGLSGYDPVVLSGAVVVLGAVVLIAGYLPARRASRITPMEALRYE